MRQSEVTGLAWEHVDLERGLVDVSWQLRFVKTGATIPSKYRFKHLAGNYWLIQPKTRAGDRVVPLAPQAWATLKAWKEVAPENPWGLVFPAVDRRHGKGAPLVPRDPLRDRAAWYALQAKAGVKKGTNPGKKPGDPDVPVYWKLHEARHATATILIVEGVEPSIVAAILGQSVLVRAYVHLKAENARPALDTIAGVLDWTKKDEEGTKM